MSAAARRGGAALTVVAASLLAVGSSGAVVARSHPPGPQAALPPGVVKLARVKTPQGPPQGPVAVSLYRARYMGGTVLCINQQPQGDGGCVTYPVGRSNKYAGGVSHDLWLLGIGHGSCKPPRFQVVTAIVLRPGLTAWLRTPHGITRMSAAVVPKALGVSGPLVDAVLTQGPDTIVLRNTDAQTVYSTPAFSPGPKGYCGGLNPATTS